MPVSCLPATPQGLASTLFSVDYAYTYGNTCTSGYGTAAATERGRHKPARQPVKQPHVSTQPDRQPHARQPCLPWLMVTASTTDSCWLSGWLARYTELPE